MRRHHLILAAVFLGIGLGILAYLPDAIEATVIVLRAGE